MGKDILEIRDGYQLSREEIIGERKMYGEWVNFQGIAFSLLKNGEIIRVWWGNTPTPDEIRQVIDKVEGAIA